MLLVASMVRSFLLPIHVTDVFQIRFILEIYAKHGFHKRVTLSVDQLEGYYNNLCKLLNDVAAHPYHGKKLDRMLTQWAQIGM